MKDLDGNERQACGLDGCLCVEYVRPPKSDPLGRCDYCTHHPGQHKMAPVKASPTVAAPEPVKSQQVLSYFIDSTAHATRVPILNQLRPLRQALVIIAVITAPVLPQPPKMCTPA